MMVPRQSLIKTPPPRADGYSSFTHSGSLVLGDVSPSCHPSLLNDARPPLLCPIQHKRPEEIALGDRLVSEERPENDGGPGRAEGGPASEPSGFLKKVFSVPKNVRRTVAAGDVVVPVIGARDGWGGIRQASAAE